MKILATALMATLFACGWQTFGAGSIWTLLYQGNRVQNAVGVLAEATAWLKAEATPSRGVVPDGSLCYFVSAPGDSGKSPVPVTDEVACGPLQLTSGGVTVPFLTFHLTAGVPRHGRVRMVLDRASPPTPLSMPPSGQRLVRPDGRVAPGGAGDLNRPGVPPAIGDVLATTPSVSPPPPTVSVPMIGMTSGVALTSYGRVEQYGLGDQARSAPVDRVLIAFKAKALPGAYGSEPPQLFLRVDGKRRGPLVLTSDYVVAAVPVAATDVALVLAGQGVDQSISLLNGEPGPTNPVLTKRAHTTVTLNAVRSVNLRVKTPKGAGIVSGHVTVTSLTLLYWAPDGSRASGAGRALLQIVATLQLAGDRTTYGVEPELLAAGATGDTLAKAHNAAKSGTRQVVAVVDVPADITTGTVTFSGSTTISGKGTLTVQTPLRIDFAFDAN